MIFEKKTEECSCGAEISHRTDIAGTLKLTNHVRKEHSDLLKAAGSGAVTGEEVVEHLFGEGEDDFLSRLEGE